MKNKQIVFTKPNTAELLITDYKKPLKNEVVVKTAFSTVSCGTERANITGDPNVSAGCAAAVNFPRKSGYSSSGIIVEKGMDVKNFDIGDRVVVYWGTHSQYNTVPESQIIKIENETISFEEAALSFISTFSLAAIRKTHLEIGESAIVMGLGLLGQFAVRLLKAAGACLIIAIDPIDNRRKEALDDGADYVFSPFEDGFVEKVKTITGGGVNVAIEVTGAGAGFDSVLDCMAKFGRVALLGCTRDKNFTIDYYRKIHYPGITVVGAHTLARPENESYPGYFTHNDDIKAVLKLCSCGRIDFKSMIKETHAPQNCADVYARLINDKDFPTVVQFDWSQLK
ncbi:MAG: zinc-binding alcohol dehydrogenase [Clostridia bacterium]|nr:zinc-binding alcohol dehydrogenase [Clostridia bacterium]